MERSEQVKICQQCKNRKMDLGKGLLCGLTNQFADFEETCPDFVDDHSSSLIHDYREIRFNDRSDDIPPSINKYLTLLILFSVVLGVITFLLESYELELRYNFYFMYSSFFVREIAVWLFIGYTLNKVRAAFFSALIYISVHIVFSFFPLISEYTFWLIPISAAVYFFASQTINNNQQNIKFLIGAIIIFKGISPLERSPFQLMLKLAGRSDDLLWDNQNLLIFTGDILSSTVVMAIGGILVVLIHQWVSNNFDFNIKTLSLSHVLTNRKMGVFVGVFYSAILLLSYMLLFGFIYIAEDIVTTNRNPEEALSFANYIAFSINILMSIGLLFFICIYYRKITLEYYLGCNKKLSWNYFFAHVPIINLFVWWANLSSFKPLKTYQKDHIEGILTQSHFDLFLVLFSLLGIKYFIVIASPNVVPMDLLFGLIDVSILLFYTYNKYGMHFIITFELIAFVIIFFVSVYESQVNFSDKLISYSVFFGVARMIIIYPIFHGREFTVSLPKSLESDWKKPLV